MRYLIYLAVFVVVVIIYRIIRSMRLMKPEQFADAVRAKIESDYPDITIKEEDGFKWTLGVGDNSPTMYLDNLYARYRIYPKHFDELVDHFIKAMTGTPETEIGWEEAKARILPALKPQIYLDETRKLANAAALVDDLVVMDYRDGLKVLLAIDSETSMFFATKTQLEQWGVSADQAYQQAVDNLGKLTAQLWVDASEMGKQHGIFAFNTQDGYDASRLLLPDFYERASRALGCERIAVGVPNRDFIVAIPADDTDKLPQIAKQVENDFSKYDHSISPEMIFLPE